MSSTRDQTEDLREKWTHEDDLINHRITWLFVSQTLLFAGYGLLLQVRSSNPTPATEVLPKIDRMIWWLPVVGFVTSLLILIGVVAAGAAMIALRQRNKGPRLDVHLGTSTMGWFSACGLPLVFVIVWFAILRS